MRSVGVVVRLEWSRVWVGKGTCGSRGVLWRCGAEEWRSGGLVE